MMNKFFYVLQECPNGYLTEETFRRVFQQFFPVGGQLHKYSNAKLKSSQFWL